ncbi:MAG: carbamoyl-phosphate-synthetase, partial [Eubacterium sp.]|nr:carbamoyl-phosphate-synthetase [Eubacterium sp.]
ASGYYAYYAVHSYTDGILKRIEISEEASKHILENHLIARPGDEIRAFSGANTTLGILLMKFDSMEEMLEMMDHSDKWIRVHLES